MYFEPGWINPNDWTRPSPAENHLVPPVNEREKEKKKQEATNSWESILSLIERVRAFVRALFALVGRITPFN
jgi:hypothetical protein